MLINFFNEIGKISNQMTILTMFQVFKICEKINCVESIFVISRIKNNGTM